MNSKEITVYKCSECGQAYLDKSVADKCCQPKLCEDCGCELPRSHPYIVCDRCKSKRKQKQELDRYNKATHYTFKTVPEESIEYMFSELYPYNEGFMYDFEDYMEEEYGIKYVYGTKRISPSYDAQDIVDSMLEESYEDVVERVNEDEIAKLQEAIDTFVKNHGGSLDWFEVDYKVVIDLE